MKTFLQFLILGSLDRILFIFSFSCFLNFWVLLCVCLSPLENTNFSVVSTHISALSHASTEKLKEKVSGERWGSCRKKKIERAMKHSVAGKKLKSDTWSYCFFFIIPFPLPSSLFLLLIPLQLYSLISSSFFLSLISLSLTDEMGSIGTKVFTFLSCPIHVLLHCKVTLFSKLQE